MAVLVDPDDLSQGASTTVTDMVFGTPTGNAVTLTSAGANLPALSDDMFFEIRDHSETVNNGLYEVDDASPTTSEVDVLKVTGSNPVAATSESCDTLGNTTTEKSIFYDTAAREIYLLEQGNLDEDGATGQCIYSRAVIDWKDDDFLIAGAPFPMTCIDADAGKYIQAKIHPATTTVGIGPTTLLSRSAHANCFATAGGAHILRPVSCEPSTHVS